MGCGSRALHSPFSSRLSIPEPSQLNGLPESDALRQDLEQEDAARLVKPFTPSVLTDTVRSRLGAVEDQPGGGTWHPAPGGIPPLAATDTTPGGRASERAPCVFAGAVPRAGKR